MIRADLHVHTLASGHAYSTIREACSVAVSRGIEMLAVTDHGPALPGGPHLYHFTNLAILPRNIDGVKVLRGAECNIIGLNGELDLPERALGVLDIVLAGIHPHCGYEGQSVEENTQAVIGAMRSGKVDVLVHPDNPLYPLDYRAVVEAASSLGVLVEINNASLTVVRKGGEQNVRVIAEEAKRLQAKVCVNSDAHDASLVGEVSEALKIVQQVGIEKEQISNRDGKSVLQFLRARGKEINI